MMELEVIQKQIEVERSRLNRMEQQHGLLHPMVIKQSMKLDELILKYTRLVNDEN